MIFAKILCLLLLLTSCGSSKKDSYRIGIDSSWYPLELMGREKHLYAFAIELLQEIATAEKLSLSLIESSWDNLLPGLHEKKYDAILSSLYPYLFYEKKYSFSDLFLPTGPVLVMQKDAPYHELSALEGKEIAVLADTEGALLAEKYPGILLRNYDSIPNALNDIVQGAIDGALIDVQSANSYLSDLYHNELAIQTPPLSDSGLRMVSLAKQQRALLHAFNHGLKQLKESGKLDELCQKWGLYVP